MKTIIYIFQRSKQAIYFKEKFKAKFPKKLKISFRKGLLTFENESVKAIAVILVETRSVWMAVRNSVTRLTKSAA